MRVALALSLTLSQAACVATAPAGSSGAEPVRVSNGGKPYQMWDGAAARKAADAACGSRGVRASIYDRFDRATSEWVYPGGCA
jgi:hypothetical protein